jgi:ribosomal protection tetracycline resistance protein
MDYSIKLSSLTSGKGRIRMSFYKYDVCPPNSGIIREYKGVNPLDESQWILHRRGAYKAEERKL